MKKKTNEKLTKEQEDALRILNAFPISAEFGSKKRRIHRVRTSKSLPNLNGLRIACCSQNHKRAALLFDIITTATTMFERENPNYEEIPEWVAASDSRVITKARKISFERGMAALPEEFNLSTFQAIHRDALLVEIARICRAQGANAAVLDLTYPQVLLPDSVTSSPLGVVAALSTIPIAVEDKLSWEQIKDFRSDEDSVRKYRDLHLWLDDGLTAKTEQQAIDLIAQKIEDYHWAIRKHGIVATLEAVGCLLAAGTMLPSAGGVVAALTQLDQRIAMIAGVGLAIMGVTAWVSKRIVELDDVKRGKNREIAYLYDIKQILR